MRAPKGIEQKRFTNSAPLQILMYRESPQQDSRDDWVVWHLLYRLWRELGELNCVGRECVETCNGSIARSKHKDGGDSAANVLRSLPLKVPIQRLHPAGKIGTVMVAGERFGV